jgi:hypothetical protein
VNDTADDGVQKLANLAHQIQQDHLHDALEVRVIFREAALLYDPAEQAGTPRASPALIALITTCA